MTSMLDQYRGIISLPESGFPQLLGYLSERQWKRKDLIAAAYLRACFGGSLLSLEEAHGCIVDDRKETLTRLGIAEAGKAGRDTAGVSYIIWKTTRMISQWRTLSGIGGGFAIIDRDALNVFESYLRVGFAAKNRKPLRFAVYLRGYEAALAAYPPSMTERFDYPKLAEQLPAYLRHLGVDPEDRHNGPSTLAAVSDRFEFHAEILGDFKDRDGEKRGNLSAEAARRVTRARGAIKPFGYPCFLLRRYADLIQARTILRDAEAALTDGPNE